MRINSQHTLHGNILILVLLARTLNVSSLRSVDPRGMYPGDVYIGSVYLCGVYLLSSILGVSILVTAVSISIIYFIVACSNKKHHVCTDILFISSLVVADFPIILGCRRLQRRLAGRRGEQDWEGGDLQLH